MRGGGGLVGKRGEGILFGDNLTLGTVLEH